MNRTEINKQRLALITPIEHEARAQGKRAYREQRVVTPRLDAFVSFYQFSCFPVYRIAKVARGDYIVFDRQQLEYLNFIEKFHCTYCAYGNGLMAYVSEIVGRTEEYFCPIKHARKVRATHSRYPNFLAYGEVEDYEKKLEKYRVALGEKKPHSKG